MKNNNASRLLPVAAGLCAALPLSALAATAVLTADATLNASSPGTNYGTSATLSVSPSPSTTGAASLLRFDLSSLPANLTSGLVNKATLKLWVATLSGPGTLEAREVTSSFPTWTEAGVTQSGFGASSTVASTARTAALDAARQWVAVDVTDMVKDWLDAPSGNLGLYLQANVAASFDSKENSTTSHPAMLEIDTTGSAVASFTGALAGDITGTQGATVVGQVGGSTAANIHAAEQAANAATDANTAGALVRRDTNGNFAAGAITAAAGAFTSLAVTGGAPATGKVLTSDASGNAAWQAPPVTLLPWVAVSGTSQAMAPNTGYAATNAAQTTLTLPASPAVGNIVRVTGVSAGNWKLAQNANQTVSGLLQAPGLVWTARDSTRNWSAMASSSDGNKLVAAVRGGKLYTSTDSGVTWTPRMTDSNREWQAVASSSDGSKLAATEGIRLYTSTDSGATWTVRMTVSQSAWTGVASSSDGTKLVAAVAFDHIYTSTDSGVTWTPRMTDSIHNWSAVASSSDGTKLVAAEDGGWLYTSTDSGATWTARMTNRSRNWHGVASSDDGAKLAAAPLSGQLYISTDNGATWTARGKDSSWSGVASSSDGTKLVAAGNGLYTSTDSGVTWTLRDSRLAWRIVASSSDSAKLAAVLDTGQMYTSSIPSGTVSTTAGTAGLVIGDPDAALELMYVGNNRFKSLSHEGNVYAQ